jgi:septum formation protein
LKHEARNPTLILASASPRRAELLRNAGIEFTVVPAHISEYHRPGELPGVFVQRMAREKAEAIARQFHGRFVLGADTEVIVDGEVLGKPADAASASRMLRLLSGRTHLVTTGVSLIGNGIEETRSETTEVTFAELREDEIREYVASGEPMDKAGAYGIQGIASRWVTRLDGCYFNVVGLPVSVVYRMLRAHGVF